ncbi:hypothetical protein JCM8097_001427 [Rhodosporidiobolus ruineniae]
MPHAWADEVSPPEQPDRRARLHPDTPPPRTQTRYRSPPPPTRDDPYQLSDPDLADSNSDEGRPPTIRIRRPSSPMQSLAGQLHRLNVFNDRPPYPDSSSSEEDDDRRRRRAANNTLQLGETRTPGAPRHHHHGGGIGAQPHWLGEVDMGGPRRQHAPLLWNRRLFDNARDTSPVAPLSPEEWAAQDRRVDRERGDPVRRAELERIERARDTQEQRARNEEVQRERGGARQPRREERSLAHGFNHGEGSYRRARWYR